MASIRKVIGFQAFTVWSQPGISAGGTKAVDMNAIGKKSRDNVPVACSLLVRKAGTNDVPAHAIPNSPERTRISAAPTMPVLIVAPRTMLKTRMPPAMIADSKNSGASSPNRIETRRIGSHTPGPRSPPSPTQDDRLVGRLGTNSPSRVLQEDIVERRLRDRQTGDADAVAVSVEAAHQLRQRAAGVANAEADSKRLRRDGLERVEPAEQLAHACLLTSQVLGSSSFQLQCHGVGADACLQIGA